MVGLTSTTSGTVLKRRLDLGQIIIQTDTADNFGQTETISSMVNDVEYRVKLISESLQYNSVHHYLDSEGEIVDTK